MQPSSKLIALFAESILVLTVGGLMLYLIISWAQSSSTAIKPNQTSSVSPSSVPKPPEVVKEAALSETNPRSTSAELVPGPASSETGSVPVPAPVPVPEPIPAPAPVPAPVPAPETKPESIETGEENKQGQGQNPVGGQEQVKPVDDDTEPQDVSTDSSEGLFGFFYSMIGYGRSGAHSND